MEVYLNGRPVRLDPSRAIGKGGEADIFAIGRGLVLKLFKTPNHPDLAGLPNEQAAAKARIAEHQHKLPAFPSRLPSRVIVPKDLVHDKKGLIVGYTMRYLDNTEPFLRYSEPNFRTNIPATKLQKIMTDLHTTVNGLHRSGVIIGDFNDLNILVAGDEAYLIDADSYQFGQFPCRVFTAKFVDPLLCDPKLGYLMLARTYRPESDWYAYACLYFQSLLFVGPYGGVYRPKVKAKAVPQSRRPLERITVFHPDVRYPRPATHYKVLPDDLLDYFHKVFEKDRRETFPLDLVDKLRWTKCPHCGLEHARPSCPDCARPAPQVIKAAILVHGQVTATRVFRTSGHIVFAAYQNGRLLWLANENGNLKRENGSPVPVAGVDPLARYRLCGNTTLIGTRTGIETWENGRIKDRLPVDAFGNLPVFDANSSTRFWLRAGRLEKDGPYASEYVGDVLENQTLFWAGDDLGFGFYRAGALSVAFVFDPRSKGLNDSARAPRLTGQLIDSTVCFGTDRVWLLAALQTGGRRLNRCFLYDRSGHLLAEAETEADDGTWLGQIRGKCAARDFLLAATDDGIVRIEADTGRLVESKSFPDTAKFVHSGQHLFVGPQGLYVVGPQEIMLLTIS